MSMALRRRMCALCRRPESQYGEELDLRGVMIDGLLRRACADCRRHKTWRCAGDCRLLQGGQPQVIDGHPYCLSCSLRSFGRPSVEDEDDDGDKPHG
jgi:hypothetical protein